MITVKISEFKAKCLEMLDRVSRTGESLVITRRGHPLARVLPVESDTGGEWIGCLRGTAQAKDDLIAPAVGAEEWEALEE